MRTFFAVPPLRKLRYLVGLPLGGFASSAFAMADSAVPAFDLTSDSGAKSETASPEDSEQAKPRPTLNEAMGASPTETASSRYPRDSLTIGIGVITLPSYPGSGSNVLSPAGLIRGSVNGFSFSSRGANLSVDLIRERSGSKVDISFGPVANLRSDRSGGIKDAQIKTLGKIDRTIELGGWAGIGKTGVLSSDFDQLSVGVKVVRDILGKHRSTIITPTIDYGTPLSRTTFVGISASASFVGKTFGRTYYDVSPAGSARSGLPTYSAAGRKSGLTHYSLGAIAIKSLTGDLRKGWTLLAGTQYSRVQGRYARSPVVRQRSQWVGGLGLAFTF